MPEKAAFLTFLVAALALNAGQTGDLADGGTPRSHRLLDPDGRFHDAAPSLRVAVGANFHSIEAGHADFKFTLNAILTVAVLSPSILTFR